MSELLKVQVQDEEGNIYYMHTSADVVFCEDGTTVEAKLNGKFDKTNIVQNAATAAADKVPSAAVAKNLQDQITAQNTKIGLRSVYVSQTGTYTFQMQPGTLALVITYYGIYPHYCTGNGQITANQLVIQDGENTITSVNGNTVSVYNRYDRNNMAQAIIFFIEPN